MLIIMTPTLDASVQQRLLKKTHTPPPPLPQKPERKHNNQKPLMQSKYPMLNYHNSEAKASLLQQGQHYYRYHTDHFNIHLS